MKKYLNKKKVIGYIGINSYLAKQFIDKYKNKFEFKAINLDIRDEVNIKKWFLKNNNINIFINFAAITSTRDCERNKTKSLNINYQSPINLLNIINQSNMNNFSYFLTLSSSHVFKPSRLKVHENSEKKPINYYGKTKHYLEKFILNNSKKFNFDIGIARVFNYYNKDPKKKFFINDIKKILSNDKKKVFFKKVFTYRDFISITDINSALYKMIQLELNGDYNICSGKRVYLSKIIQYLNHKMNKKTLVFDSKKYTGIVGSNIKLKRKGWILRNKNFLKQL